MAEKFKRLRASGEIGSWVANLLVFLTTNWGLVVSVLIALFTGTVSVLRTFALTPAVYVSVGAFLAILWTYIGISTIAVRKRPQLMRQDWDFAYSLSVEGYQIGLDKDSPDAALQLIVNFRNMANLPIRIRPEEFRVIIGDRTIPDAPIPGDLILRRVATRGIRSGLFKKDVIQPKTTAHVTLSILYGPAEGEFTRRYCLISKLHLAFQGDNLSGVADELVSETDVAI